MYKITKVLRLEVLFITSIILFCTHLSAEEEEILLQGISDQIQVITKDLKTLEKAVYKKSDVINSSNINSSNSSGLNEDILTKHLLKLNEIEDQFRELTNKFEEVNFKLDKLSSRVTKIQSDTQLRFTDLEAGNLVKTENKKNILPGTSKPQDFGANPGYQTSSLPSEQSLNSVESAQTVIVQQPEKKETLLPNKTAPEQYEFAVSFMKIGDYETAEAALKEFIDKNKDHDLAGSAQYWYGETFRIRQLYSDAATAYLDGYQNYPKSKKAPDNLLKLGITMVQLGEKDQGCKMILGLKKEYPKASKSVLQKAQYEQKNSNAILKSQFKNFKNLKEIYLNFKIKLLKLRGKSFLVSVSGGPDSLALTALTKSYKLENNNVNFIYVLIDHRIRKNSSKEALAVKNLLKNRKISLKILANKIKIDRNIQSQARDIRYQILTNFCKKNKINNILTGHNLEDQVETFFIRLSRGSGLTGLSAMKQSNLLTKNIRLSRPLLDVKKEKLIKISKLIFGKYFKDPSNNNDKYLRTKIRRLKIPLKKSGIKYEQIIKSINNLASSKAVLDGYLNNEFERLAKVSKSQIKINLKKFNHLRELSKMEIINKSIKSLRNNYYNPRSKKVLKLIENIKNSNFSKATLAGCLFAKNKQNLSIKNEKI